MKPHKVLNMIGQVTTDWLKEIRHCRKYGDIWDAIFVLISGLVIAIAAIFMAIGGVAIVVFLVMAAWQAPGTALIVAAVVGTVVAVAALLWWLAEPEPEHHHNQNKSQDSS